MLKKPIICLCLIAASPLRADSYEPLPEPTCQVACEEPKERLSWKKFMLYAGVFVIGVVTFVYVATQNDK
jgi:hypothetical protein